MAIQRKSQIPKAPERSLVDSIVDGPAQTPDPVQAPTLALAPEPVTQDETTLAAAVEATQEAAPQQGLRPPARRQRKPNRTPYTSKMDPELKAWAMSYKAAGEDLVEVVEQALWVLRLARSGQMTEAVDALE